MWFKPGLLRRAHVCVFTCVSTMYLCVYVCTCAWCLLHLSLQTGSIALIGPHANATQIMLSNYHGTNTLVDSHSPLAAFTAVFGKKKINYAQGCNIDDDDTSGIAGATSAAKASEVAIVFVGLDETQEREGHDRVSLELPGVQDQLVKAVLGANKKTIVVLVNGGPLAIEWIKDNVPAIVEAFYPGELGGDAVADVLLGNVNPSGRLPYTVYPADYIKRSYFDMSLRDNGGCTYRFYQGKPLWTFGYGLSYTVFNYSWSGHPHHQHADAKRIANGRNTISYTVNVTNTGNMAGYDSVLGFLTDQPQPDAPQKELFDFGRVFLEPGESATVHLTVGPQQLSSVDEEGTQFIKTGHYGVKIGDLESSFHVTGADHEMFSLKNIKNKSS